jgi:hypothetical protein
VISTVTTSTIATVTATGVAAGLGLIAVLALLALLVVRELAGASTQPALQRAGRVLVVGIAPLLLAFAAIVVVRVVGLLS